MKPYRILIVEGQPFQLMHLQHQFNKLGFFHLEAARTGHEALELLSNRSFDLVLTDLLMPEMDGVQFIQTLALLSSKPAVAIMSVASRRMMKAAGLVGQHLGVSVIGLLSKPINLSALQSLSNRLDEWSLTQKNVNNMVLNLDREHLIEAMRDGQLLPWYQPKKSLASGRIVAAEALARWVHPEHGVLLPASFLPAINTFELEENLLMQCLSHTVNAQAYWRQSGYEVPVSINLPTHLLDREDLPDQLHDFVLHHHGEPRHITFELMENSTTQNISHFYAGACRLRIKGFGLAQDDFGKGFSSFLSLASTPFTELKIDRILVHGCHESEGLASVLSSIISMGTQLGLTVIAEGVETPQELALLRKINCTQVQGFVVSPAVSFDCFKCLLINDGPQ